jgi:hypothetical protein
MTGYDVPVYKIAKESKMTEDDVTVYKIAKESKMAGYDVTVFREVAQRTELTIYNDLDNLTEDQVKELALRELHEIPDYDWVDLEIYEETVVVTKNLKKGK